MCVALTVAAYPLREKWVCDVAAYNRACRSLHTHFVRSGYVMLRPMRSESYPIHAGYNIRNPPLTRWVCPPSRRRVF